MKMVITGGLGFIGSHLVDRLAKGGNDVHIIDDMSHNAVPGKFFNRENNVKFYFMDVCNPDIREIIRDADVVYHLAARINVDNSIINPGNTIRVNVDGTLNVLEACRGYGVPKVIFASTSEIYGSSQTDKMSEEHPLDAQSPYAASKVFGDRLCHSYIQTYGMNISILRNFNTFGPRQRYTQAGDCYGAVIGIFTNMIINNRPPIIFGDGTQSRDYMFIDDAISGYELCIRNDVVGPINIGTGKSIRIKDLADMLLKIIGKDVKPIYDSPRKGEVARLCADISLAQKFGYNPTTDIYDGLKKYVEWFRGQKK